MQVLHSNITKALMQSCLLFALSIPYKSLFYEEPEITVAKYLIFYIEVKFPLQEFFLFYILFHCLPIMLVEVAETNWTVLSSSSMQPYSFCQSVAIKPGYPSHPLKECAVLLDVASSLLSFSILADRVEVNQEHI